MHCQKKTRLNELDGVEELDWPAQSPDFNPSQHLWDELEQMLRAKPSHPTSLPDLTNTLQDEWAKKKKKKNIKKHSNILRKAFPEEWKLCKLMYLYL